jgi:NAD+ synthase (glutamine-hydrolysing)
MSTATRYFDSIYSHGYVRAAVCTPRLRVADPDYNAEHILELAGQASDRSAAIALFTEMGLSGYSCDDLFFQDALLDGVAEALGRIVEASWQLNPLLLIGAPLRHESKLFNCGLAVYRGQILGVTPKTYIPNYREYYEKRQFTSARDAVTDTIRLLGRDVPFGTDLIFEATNVEGFSLSMELCEDFWAPIPPSTYAALAGAHILANLSASNVTIGKSEYRHTLCRSQSGRCVSAYLFSAAGPGESTTDLAWDGQAMIFENQDLLAEATRFPTEGQFIEADLDLDRLGQDRVRLTSFNDAVGAYADTARRFRRVAFKFDIPEGPIELNRTVERFPYVPYETEHLDQRCYEAYNIQVHGLKKRLEATGIDKVVIGVSGGLDSTHALVVCAKCLDQLQLPRENILAFSLPGFATGEHTRDNAHKLMQALGVSVEEIDIRPSCEQMLRDLDHPYARGRRDPDVYDITFENVQAGERTNHLFRLANQRGAMVIGTGDLSELALGFCTYGVGDQMSHYAVNCSVPKTLIQHLIRWVSRTEQFGPEASEVLEAILDTEFSPELVPETKQDRDGQGRPAQRAEAVVGPYELQDFHLYYLLRYGFRPSKVAWLARHAWSNIDRGVWPPMLPHAERNAYDLATIKHWLEVFIRRFFAFAQFKRSAIPNGPKVGSGGSLSPRGDWRAPSDASAEAWLEELRRNVP